MLRRLLNREPVLRLTTFLNRHLQKWVSKFVSVRKEQARANTIGRKVILATRTTFKLLKRESKANAEKRQSTGRNENITPPRKHFHI